MEKRQEQKLKTKSIHPGLIGSGEQVETVTLVRGGGGCRIGREELEMSTAGKGVETGGAVF